MKHEFRRIDLGNDLKYRRQLCSRCSCGFLTDVVTEVKKAEDNEREHIKDARAQHLGLLPAKPSLSTTLKHYERMANHPAATIPEREQWHALADEVRHRIDNNTIDHTIGQGSLFGED